MPLKGLTASSWANQPTSCHSVAHSGTSRSATAPALWPGLSVLLWPQAAQCDDADDDAAVAVAVVVCQLYRHLQYLF